MLFKSCLQLFSKSIVLRKPIKVKTLESICFCKSVGTSIHTCISIGLCIFFSINYWIVYNDEYQHVLTYVCIQLYNLMYVRKYTKVFEQSVSKAYEPRPFLHQLLSHICVVHFLVFLQLLLFLFTNSLYFAISLFIKLLPTYFSKLENFASFYIHNFVNSLINLKLTRKYFKKIYTPDM